MDTTEQSGQVAIGQNLVGRWFFGVFWPEPNLCQFYDYRRRRTLMATFDTEFFDTETPCMRASLHGEGIVSGGGLPGEGVPVIVTVEVKRLSAEPQFSQLGTVKMDAADAAGVMQLSTTGFLAGAFPLVLIAPGQTNPADVNRDGFVDDLDLGIVLAQQGKQLGDPDFNPDADINQDGIVDDLDLGLVLAAMGTSA